MEVNLINEVKVCANLIPDDRELKELFTYHVAFN